MIEGRIITSVSNPRTLAEISEKWNLAVPTLFRLITNGWLYGYEGDPLNPVTLRAFADESRSGALKDMVYCSGYLYLRRDTAIPSLHLNQPDSYMFASVNRAKDIIFKGITDLTKINFGQGVHVFERPTNPQ